MTDCANVLGVYDTNLIYSWTPNEMKALFKGAKLREIDFIERQAISAIWHAKAQNSKKISVKKLFDADKARRKLNKKKKETTSFYTEHYDKAQADLKKYLNEGG